MSEQNHWNDLAQQLGAEVKPADESTEPVAAAPRPAAASCAALPKPRLLPRRGRPIGRRWPTRWESRCRPSRKLRRRPPSRRRAGSLRFRLRRGRARKSRPSLPERRSKPGPRTLKRSSRTSKSSRSWTTKSFPWTPSSNRKPAANRANRVASRPVRANQANGATDRSAAIGPGAAAVADVAADRIVVASRLPRAGARTPERPEARGQAEPRGSRRRRDHDRPRPRGHEPANRPDEPTEPMDREDRVPSDRQDRAAFDELFELDRMDRELGEAEERQEPARDEAPWHSAGRSESEESDDWETVDQESDLQDSDVEASDLEPGGSDTSRSQGEGESGADRDKRKGRRRRRRRRGGREPLERNRRFGSRRRSLAWRSARGADGARAGADGRFQRAGRCRPRRGCRRGRHDRPSQPSRHSVVGRCDRVYHRREHGKPLEVVEKWRSSRSPRRPGAFLPGATGTASGLLLTACRISGRHVAGEPPPSML